MNARPQPPERLEDEPAALARALDASGIGIFEYDPAGGTRFSERCKAMWGLAADEELTLKRIRTLLHPDDYPQVRNVFMALQAPGITPPGTAVPTATATPPGAAAPPGTAAAEPFVVEYRIIRPDGAVRWIRCQGRCVADPGRPPRSVGTLQDITDHRTQLADSEALFRASFEQAAVGVAHVGLDGRWLRVNQRQCTLLGYSRDELLQSSFQSVTHADDLPADLASRAALLDGRRATYSMEKRYIRRDGSPLWVRLTVSLLRDAAGAPRHFICINQDISAHVAARTALAENEARLRIAVEGAGVGTFELDLERRLVHFSPESARLHGLTETHPLTFDRASWSQLMHPEDAAAADDGVTRAIREGSLCDITFRVPLPAGGMRWIQSLGRAHYADDGSPQRFIGLNFDVTARKQVEDALRDAVEGLREADLRKDEFLATLSHELRNPLAPIRNAAQILGAAQISDQSLAWARQVIQRQVQQMAWLLDDLLDVARITQGKLELKLERVAVDHIVEAAVEAARPLLDEKNHRLTVTLSAAPPLLEADPLRLSQVLSNLLTNAAKYTDPGGRIELTARIEDDRLCFTVRDNGIGIPTEDLDRIFTMFSQVEHSRGRSDGGLGIGLALVRGIVALHGGTIEALSQGAGRGSEFHVRLPLPAAREGTAATARDGTTTTAREHARDSTRGSDPSTPAAPAASAPANERRVLVADDNADAADSLAALLGLSGHDVRVAHGGNAALTVAATFRPEVAILDVGMPDLDGYGVARALRREPWGKELRLIALTGWGQDDDKRRAREAGFDHHLTKPVDPDALEHLIRELSSNR